MGKDGGNHPKSNRKDNFNQSESKGWDKQCIRETEIRKSMHDCKPWVVKKKYWDRKER